VEIDENGLKQFNNLMDCLNYLQEIHEEVERVMKFKERYKKAKKTTTVIGVFKSSQNIKDANSDLLQTNHRNYPTPLLLPEVP
jgi:pantothenate kinase